MGAKMKRDRTAYYRAYYLANKERLRPMRRAAQRKYNARRLRTDADRLAEKLVRCLDVTLSTAREMINEMRNQA